MLFGSENDWEGVDVNFLKENIDELNAKFKFQNLKRTNAKKAFPPRVRVSSFAPLAVVRFVGKHVDCAQKIYHSKCKFGYHWYVPSAFLEHVAKNLERGLLLKSVNMKTGERTEKRRMVL